MAQFDFKAWFSNLTQTVTVWRTVMTGVLAGLVALTTWIASQVSAVGDAVDRYAKLESASRVERNAYAEAFRKGDPTKSDFLNDVVYRVRIKVMEPEVGAELLCWLAARASVRSPEAGEVDATTADKILNFMDRNKPLFGLEGGAWPWERREVAAADFCAPYLPEYAQTRGGDTAMTEAASVPPPPPPPPPPPGSGEQERPSVLESGTGLLFLHVAAETQKDAAAQLGRDVQGRHSGIAYQGVEQIATYAGRTELRYYKPEDGKVAEALAAALNCDGASPWVGRVKGYEDSRLVRPGTFELWIGPGVAGCTLAD